MKISQTVHLFSLATFLLILSSCGSSSGDKEKNSAEFDAAEQELRNQIEEVVENMPSPSEIPYLLQQTGAEFNGSLLNSKEKVDQYSTRTEKAAENLGVYATDIGYLASYDKTQEAIDYLSLCKSLAENLGVIGSFDLNLLQRFEANISNKDSLAIVLNNTVSKTQNFLKDSDRNKLAALVVTGSFIEGLYIATGLVKTYPQDILPDDYRNAILTPLIRVVLEEKKSVSDLVKLVESVEQSGTVVTLLSDLKELQKVYEELNIEEQIANNRGDLVITDKNLDQIGVIVTRMRTEITE